MDFSAKFRLLPLKRKINFLLREKKAILNIYLVANDNIVGNEVASESSSDTWMTSVLDINERLVYSILLAQHHDLRAAHFLFGISHVAGQTQEYIEYAQTLNSSIPHVIAAKYK